MNALVPLASALGLGVLAGTRLYLTVFVVGLLVRFDLLALPLAWRHASALGDTRILILAGLGCAIEFVADKIPWVDSLWDTVHTVIRPVGAALVAASLFSGLDPVYQVALVLLAGGMAFTGHSAKAATRLAVNHSPEPFSNVALSLGEDAASAGALYLLVKHPWLLATAALIFLALFAWLAPRIYRALRAELTALRALWRHWLGRAREPEVTAEDERLLKEMTGGGHAPVVFAAIGTADVRELRNRVGKLFLLDDQAVFLARRWGRRVDRKIGRVVSLEVRRRVLSDELALAGADGRRIRFDLLAGQMERARAEADRYRR